MPTSKNSNLKDAEIECVLELKIDIKSAFKCHALKSLVPIYASHHKESGNPVQVGTGFLLEHNSRPVLFTAAHVLYGHDFDDGLNDKAFHVDGNFAYVDNGSRCLSWTKDPDIAAFYADEFKSSHFLPAPAASAKADGVKFITMGGFLAREFKRNGNCLKPKPWIYTNKFAKYDNGIVSFLYPKRHNVESETGEAIVSSKPRGLSGGPMLNTVSLLMGKVEIIGVFTEQSDGVARGECASHIASILDKM